MVMTFHSEEDFLFCGQCGAETLPEDRPSNGSVEQGPRFDRATGERRMIRYRVCPRRVLLAWWDPFRIGHTEQRIHYPLERTRLVPNG